MAGLQLQGVKCLNTSSGRKRFVELNTAEDFISFYEEMMLLVQTLPQILLHREKIFSELIRRLHMGARLSLEPLLMLISALCRDILEEFLPFLQRLSDSLVDLLKVDGDRDPEVLEQVFTSWSYIMMHLQKYLTKDIVHVLKITIHLRFFPKNYVQEFMAESVSFLMRNSPVNQLTKGITKIIYEVAKSSSSVRKAGNTALLWYIMRGTSLKLQSRAEKILCVLMGKSTFSISDKFDQGTEVVLEVITGVIRRLCKEVDHKESSLIYKCLFEEISSCIGDDYVVHLDRVLYLLTSTVRLDSRSDAFDIETMLKLVRLLIQAFIVPTDSMKSEGHSDQVQARIFQLMLSLLDIPCISADLSNISALYVPAFKLKNSSLDPRDQGSYLEAFDLLGSRKSKSFFLVSTNDNQQGSGENLESVLVVPLLKKMEKIAMHMEDIQMNIIFNFFRAIAFELCSEGCYDYDVHLLYPLYKVCEGFAGKSISGEQKCIFIRSCRETYNPDGIFYACQMERSNRRKRFGTTYVMCWG